MRQGSGAARSHAGGTGSPAQRSRRATRRVSVTAFAMAGMLIAALATGVAPATAVTPIATATGSPDCLLDSDKPLGGNDAINAAGSALAESAETAGVSRQALAAELREDSTIQLDSCGYAFFEDEDFGVPHNATSTPKDTTTLSSLDPSGNAFTLHSRPNSKKTIYLDFNGHVVENSGWNQLMNLNTITAPAFSLDGSPAFSAAEQVTIKDIWLRVSEDFAPFDVDVTTQEPAAAAITRSGPSDQVYGTRALITPSAEFLASCDNRCSGRGYLGVFDATSSHAYYQPAWVSSQGYRSDRKFIAFAISHEVGHNLGLNHDGTTAHGTTGASAYYGGHGVWSPIMGGGSAASKPVTQWSHGEYSYANRAQEDDLSVMASHGITPISDDHSDSGGSATAVTTSSPTAGLIENRADQDWFRFTAAGRTAIGVAVQGVGANLDAKVTVADSSGTPIGISNPAVTAINRYSAQGQSASLTLDLESGKDYLVKVEGTGFGTVNTGYSDYASLGRYEVSIADAALPPTPTPTTKPVRKRIKVKTRAIHRRSKLSINVNPNQRKWNYRIKVQKKIRGRWKTIRVTRTRRAADVRVLNLRRGRYRVYVPAQRGYRGAISRSVRLRR